MDGRDQNNKAAISEAPVQMSKFERFKDNLEDDECHDEVARLKEKVEILMQDYLRLFGYYDDFRTIRGLSIVLSTRTLEARGYVLYSNDKQTSAISNLGRWSWGFLASFHPTKAQSLTFRRYTQTKRVSLCMV